MYAVIRVRGHGKIKRKALTTLSQLHLNRVNHMVLLPETETSRRMLQVVKDYVTWGELSDDTAGRLVQSAMLLSGDRRISDADMLKVTGRDVTSIAKELADGRVSLKELHIKGVIRLHPPRHGWEAVKKDYATGGSLGYRGKEINPLIERMLPFGEVKADGKQNE